MKIHVTFVAQLKTVRGVECETLELEEGATVRGVIDRLVESHGAEMRDALLTAEGSVRPSILVFAGEGQVDPTNPKALADGQTLTLLSPMAGG